ncbi:CASP-like protein 1D1 [Rhodamnia argentea]|uniref:CASP-like protein n=1 Tax=Rhodamnia argentea TaxID=178133 RepID=A0A8B8QWL8_9MYRT|nr:CASP-like protein 1D1 [Rhodamnia argentea]
MAKTAEPEKSVELEKVPDPEAGVPPPGAAAPPSGPPPVVDLGFMVDVLLRVLFFASTLTALVVMVTANQTNPATAAAPRLPAPLEAKFDNSPALIYFVAAMSVACLYSIITALASISVILAPIFAKDFLLFFVICDVVILGIIASATGTAGTVGYIGLNGDSHVNWGKVCNVYDTFCQHIGAASAVSLFAAVILVVLITLSVVNLHKKIPK